MDDVFSGILVPSDQVVLFDFGVALLEVEDVARLELVEALRVGLVVCLEKDAGGVLDLWAEVFSGSV